MSKKNTKEQKVIEGNHRILLFIGNDKTKGIIQPEVIVNTPPVFSN
jgi:hypothetical protein